MMKTRPSVSCAICPSATQVCTKPAILEENLAGPATPAWSIELRSLQALLCTVFRAKCVSINQSTLFIYVFPIQVGTKDGNLSCKITGGGGAGGLQFKLTRSRDFTDVEK